MVIAIGQPELWVCQVKIPSDGLWRTEIKWCLFPQSQFSCGNTVRFHYGKPGGLYGQHMRCNRARIMTIQIKITVIGQIDYRICV